MDYIDNKYIGLVGVRLEKFQKKGKSLWNFRCPICGDSKRDKTKARGYIFETPEHKVMMKCHNCSASMGLVKFIETVDPNLKKEYVVERFGSAYKRVPTNKHPTVEDFFKSAKAKFKQADQKSAFLNGVTSIKQLAPDHPARLYIKQRKIPKDQWKRLYWVDKFKEWTNTIVKNKFSDIKKDEGRLIIPFFSLDGRLTYYQGRSLQPDAKIRYITIKVDEKAPKVFGVDQVSMTDKVYVFEGPIDSLFIPNSVALAGADMPEKCSLELHKENVVVVMDNENRNKEIIKRIESAIDRGFNVCVWDTKIGPKDVNDMVLSGLNVEQIKRSIDEHTYRGLQAKVALNKWKRI